MGRSSAECLASLGSLGELLVVLARTKVRFIVIGEAAGALFGTLRQPAALDLLHDAQDRDSLVEHACVLDGCHAMPRGGPGADLRCWMRR